MTDHNENAAARSHELQPAEKDLHLLFTHTTTNYAGSYPPYINLTMIRMKGDVVLTVRLPTVFGAPPGQTSSVRFTRDMWRDFIKGIEKANTIYEAADFLDGVL